MLRCVIAEHDVCDTLTPNRTAIRQQFTSLYRYGTTRECSAKWDDVKFCMANRSLSEEQKTEEWVRRRAEFWAAKRLGPSSEDIWSAKQLAPAANEK